ncbi:MAG: hypothetical protein KAW92_13785 [Candidatus Cloacimonetes bacterium]|nr:hypothetical protein [Candidatus Cloacimonadota bacterium]
MFNKVSRKEFKEHQIQFNEYIVLRAKHITALKLKIFNLETLLVSKGILNKAELDVFNKDLDKTLR